jgi:hypothetical protein
VPISAWHIYFIGWGIVNEFIYEDIRMMGSQRTAGELFNELCRMPYSDYAAGIIMGKNIFETALDNVTQ